MFKDNANREYFAFLSIILLQHSFAYLILAFYFCI
ncbi:hypothetical protein M472_22250 [Sphingobacterium paucimobilis HER1398]|uniref:Uncharacterized protein n=1 Tax=Sphingobacterium paucimobilis HER1398 TaxID=1346330 RepID=U2JFM2_9SPHI|nr:hypothetical protein M472_22250 [Sphingobacterium paucimobilis HER1398]